MKTMKLAVVAFMIIGAQSSFASRSAGDLDNSAKLNSNLDPELAGQSKEECTAKANGDLGARTAARDSKGSQGAGQAGANKGKQ